VANVIEVIIKANDQLTTGLDKAQSSIASFNKNAIMAFAGTTLSIAGTIAMLRKYSLAGAEAEMADVKLASAMHRVGQYSVENMRALSHNADAMARLTMADDEEIKRAEALYLSFGVRITQVEALTKATLEFAAGTGMDLNSAVMLASRAFINTSESLGRYNAGLTAASGTMERTTQMIQFFNTFMGEQGVMVDTTTGAYNQLGKSIKEWSEITGSTLNMLFRNVAMGVAVTLNGIRDVANGAASGITQVTDVATTALDSYLARLHQWNVEVAATKAKEKTAGPAPIGSTETLSYMPQTWVVKSRTGARSQMQDLSKDIEDAGNAARTMGAALEAAFNENMARAQQFATIISSGITNSLISAASSGKNFFGVLAQGFGRLAVQIAEAIAQMMIMKWLMGSTTFMGFFGFAKGGVIPGAYNGLLVGGTPGRDSIPIMASPGERILTPQGNQNLEKLLAKLASGSGGNTVVFQISGVDTSTLRDNLRYGTLGRELARAGGL